MNSPNWFNCSLPTMRNGTKLKVGELSDGRLAIMDAESPVTDIFATKQSGKGWVLGSRSFTEQSARDVLKAIDAAYAFALEWQKKTTTHVKPPRGWGWKRAFTGDLSMVRTNGLSGEIHMPTAKDIDAYRAVVAEYDAREKEDA